MYSAHTTINICVHVCRKPRGCDDQKAQTSIDYFCCESSIKLICVWLYMIKAKELILMYISLISKSKLYKSKWYFEKD